MCHVISVAIPSGFHQQLREELPSEVKLDPHRNPKIAKQLPTGFDVFMLTTGEADHQCSCHLYTQIEPPMDHEQDPLDRLQDKYCRKGWSASKIERAMASARRQHEKELASEFIGLRPDVYDALCKSLPKLKRIFLLVHEYHGEYDNETFSMTKDRVSQREFSGGSFPLVEDTVLEVVS